MEEFKALEQSENVKRFLENDFFTCYENREKRYIICSCKQSYIPVEKFVESFTEIGKVIIQHNIEKFIFDKRALRAFHQPTMEWYFVEWKQKLLSKGLTKHRKILPKEEWFKKCVEAGKASIMKDYPNLPIESFNIEYYSSIMDCIKN